jgi:hypothetical protein
MPVRIIHRNGTALQWTNANPILAEGEMGLETDTKKFKIGDGILAWNALAYGGLQGNVGPQGIQGPIGPTGPQGPPSSNLVKNLVDVDFTVASLFTEIRSDLEIASNVTLEISSDSNLILI